MAPQIHADNIISMLAVRRWMNDRGYGSYPTLDYQAASTAIYNNTGRKYSAEMIKNIEQGNQVPSMSFMSDMLLDFGKDWSNYNSFSNDINGYIFGASF